MDSNEIQGEGYNSASAISGKYNGVQMYIRQKHTLAFHAHSVSRSINLAISETRLIKLFIYL
jgi:exonuclease III